MKTHSLIQGSPEWHAHRRQFFNASDAPAMMGCSSYKSRDQLLHEMHTGLAQEFDAATQRRFDDGHRFEALARPLAESIIGEELYPVVGSSGKYSASFDGLTMAEDLNFEHKTLNDELRTAMVEGCTGADLPLAYRVQIEQQHMVSGACKTLFMASKWEGDTLIEERHCWYESDPELADKIDAGWEQFAVDLAAYTPPAAAAPAPTGRAPETLPALLITVKGEVTASNLAEFKETALAAIRSVNRELTNDQQFADAEKAVKWCADIEERVAGAKQHALSQTATIDQLFKTMDDISAEARQVRLDLEKLVKARKLSLKTEILVEAQTALANHLREQNAKLGRDYMPQVTADFAGAIHGKKNFDSMRAAINATLANAKIEANAAADKIQRNLNTLKELASDYKFLFADTGQIVLKAPDDLQALVKSRIADHKAETERKEQETRDRIRAEEQEKAEKDARDKLAREQAEAAQKLIDDAAVAKPAVHPEQRADELFDEAHPQISQPAPAANVVPMRAAAPAPAVAPATPPTLKLGDVQKHLAPLSITADGLRVLGFEPAGRDRAAVLYHGNQLPHILTAAIQYLTKARDQLAKAA